ncbi:DNA phosphorothioation-dependent restriction protein DptF [Methanococcus maripaludis]|uniref:DNA phosphorothioation-dependent restriction protein DptF n=1 Tax=Methanococcus maripaludis TaxID=39152 RepID=A0A7J9PLQ8_METMI|nr:DNA phosphorothioation-dependent restriction protein DptF [Methanococcus maripaludis]MBA2864031.1 DNA phosphorothioation-dependent restriction protein DptF [Methanococcus maripaludis]
MSDNCFIDGLKILKKSSKEAVGSINEFEEFKEYMHVERPIQNELFDIIKKANDADGPQLILVCGGVGDGKSHTISYLKHRYPELLNNFNIHNDATESNSPDKSAIETLDEILWPFSDNNLENILKRDKWIVAINLGTLNNFINSEFSSNYSKLLEYIEENNILESEVSDEVQNISENFHHVNFSDYQLYTVSNDGVKSKYIENIIGKIIGKNGENPFYRGYSGLCSNCSEKDKCPVKINYELISNEKFREKLIEIIIEAIIKYKLIISTRDILNFMYYLIVTPELDSHASENIKDKINSQKTIDYIQSLTPYLVFEGQESSKIMKFISNLNPLNKRNKDLDLLLIELNTSENLLNMVNSYSKFEKIPNFENEISDGSSISKSDKKTLIEFIIRSRLFFEDSSDSMKDAIYGDYLKNLYLLNKHEKNKDIKTIHEDIKKAIYCWNGNGIGENLLNVSTGSKQFKYLISHSLEIKPNYESFKPRSESCHELLKFLPYLQLDYSLNDTNIKIEVDYFLYELLMKIKEGYRPNKKDKSTNIKFNSQMSKISTIGSQNELYVAKIGDDEIKFKLEYDDEFKEYTISGVR